MTLSQFLARYLKNQGITQVFGIPSYVGMGLLHAIKEENFNFVLNMHEQNAAHAAEGYYYATGKPAVLSLAIGPGVTNAITGISNAYCESVPMIILAARASNKFRGRNEYHANTGIGRTIDENQLLKSCTKGAFYIDNLTNAASMIMDAFRLAVSGRPGPVYISIPPELQKQEIEFDEENISNLGFQTSKNIISKEEITNIEKEFSNAKKPVIVFGSQIKTINQQILQKLLKNNCPYFTTYGAKGHVPILPNYLGTSWYCNSENIAEVVEQSDLILAIGEEFTAFSARAFNNANYDNGKKIIQISEYSEELGRSFKIHKGLSGSLNAFLSDFNPTKKSWNYNFSFQKPDTQEFNTLNVIQKLADILPDDSNFFADVGNAGYASITDLNLKPTQKFYTTGKFGVCGWSIPASMGYSYASDEITFSIIGDLSFLMNSNELSNFKNLKTKSNIILFNNSSPQNILQDQLGEVGVCIQTEMPKVYFELFANAVGLKYLKVKNWADFNKIKNQNFNKENHLIEVIIKQDDYPLRD